MPTGETPPSEIMLRIRDICRTPLAYSPGTMSIERRIVLALIKVRRERGKRCRIGDRRGLDSIMGGDFAFDLRHARECFVPARFQFAATSRLAGSAASYCRKARSAA